MFRAAPRTPVVLHACLEKTTAVTPFVHTDAEDRVTQSCTHPTNTLSFAQSTTLVTYSRGETYFFTCVSLNAAAVDSQSTILHGAGRSPFIHA